jgi:hypothetical protein
LSKKELIECLKLIRSHSKLADVQRVLPNERCNQTPRRWLIHSPAIPPRKQCSLNQHVQRYPPGDCPIRPAQRSLAVDLFDEVPFLISIVVNDVHAAFTTQIEHVAIKLANAVLPGIRLQLISA